MDVMVSPYHLSGRDPVALAALLLGERAVTYLPTPASGESRASVQEAASRSPRYLELMNSWRWSAPLWRGGVIGSIRDGEDAGADVEAVRGELAQGVGLPGLGEFVRRDGEGNGERYLDALCADVLKGGANPGISIAVGVGMDRFAARHGLMVARSGEVSVSQRMESRMGRRLFALAVPVLVRASAGCILETRAALAGPLAQLRSAVVGQALDDSPESRERLGDAAAAYGSAFGDVRRGVVGEDDDEGTLVVDGYASITAMAMPTDVVLRSGAAAMRALRSGGLRRSGGAVGSVRVAGVDGEVGDGAAGTVISLVVRVMKARPEGASPDRRRTA